MRTRRSRRSSLKRSGPSNRAAAEVVVLGCGGMAALEYAVLEWCGVHVTDGVATAVTVAQSLVQLGLRTSKVRTYANPLPKDLKGFPFGR